MHSATARERSGSLAMRPQPKLPKRKCHMHNACHDAVRELRIAICVTLAESLQRIAPECFVKATNSNAGNHRATFVVVQNLRPELVSSVNTTTAFLVGSRIQVRQFTSPLSTSARPSGVGLRHTRQGGQQCTNPDYAHSMQVTVCRYSTQAQHTCTNIAAQQHSSHTEQAAISICFH